MTTQLYYQKPYAAEADAQITAIEPKGSNTIIQLDQTIFYPEGGGQPNDQGQIIGAKGSLKVELVQYKSGIIIHQGKMHGLLEDGEKVRLQLKWSFRHQNMRIHSAGHLIHDVFIGIASNLIPTKGSHGSKAFLQYAGEVDTSIKDELERLVNESVLDDLPVVMRESSYEEIEKSCQFVPAGLPRNKPLRTLQIGTFSPMPDGGVHVKSTKEIGRVLIQEITSTDGVTIVKYRTASGESA